MGLLLDCVSESRAFSCLQPIKCNRPSDRSSSHRSYLLRIFTADSLYLCVPWLPPPIITLYITLLTHFCLIPFSKCAVSLHLFSSMLGTPTLMIGLLKKQKKPRRGGSFSTSMHKGILMGPISLPDWTILCL